MDKKKLYVILLVPLIAVSLLLPCVINAVSDVIVGKITDRSAIKTEAETESETEPETGPELESIFESETESEMDLQSELPDESESETDLETGLETEIKDVDGSENDAVAVTGIDAKMEDSDAAKSFLTSSGLTGTVNQEETQSSSEGKSESTDLAQAERLNEMEAFVASFQPDISISDTAADSYTDFLNGRETQFLSAIGEYIYSIYDDLVQVTRIEVVEMVRNSEEECSCQIEMFTEDGNSELFICSYNKKWDYYGVYSLYSVD
ncbi:MAG: hypothetical protein LUD18_09125 [Lachnospiraceae bacterium]|nr:hypothetical protein [Lachnospiraceae bacterium]